MFTVLLVGLITGGSYMLRSTSRPVRTVAGFFGGLAVATFLTFGAHAAESRLFVKMPAGTPISGVDAKKSKKPIWLCSGVKTGPKGNWNSVPGARAVILADVPQGEDAAENGNKAVRCKLQVYDRSKHRMTNAELGDTAE